MFAADHLASYWRLSQLDTKNVFPLSAIPDIRDNFSKKARVSTSE